MTNQDKITLELRKNSLNRYFFDQNQVKILSNIVVSFEHPEKIFFRKFLSQSAAMWLSVRLERSLSPGALSQDFVEVQGDGVLGDESFDLVLESLWKNPHQGLGSETVLGALLVITWTKKNIILKCSRLRLSHNYSTPKHKFWSYTSNDSDFIIFYRMKKAKYTRLHCITSGFAYFQATKKIIKIFLGSQIFKPV